MVLHGLLGDGSWNNGTNWYWAGNLLQFWRVADRCPYDRPRFGICVFHVVYRYHPISIGNTRFYSFYQRFGFGFGFTLSNYCHHCFSNWISHRFVVVIC